jgi:hypothetical protein
MCTCFFILVICTYIHIHIFIWCRFVYHTMHVHTLSYTARFLHIYIYAYIHTYIQIIQDRGIRALCMVYTYTYTYTYIHTYIHTYKHTNYTGSWYPRTLQGVYIYIYSYIHTYIQTTQDRGIRALCKCLGKESILSQLNICDNQVHSEGGKFLGRALQTNTSLLEVS